MRLLWYCVVNVDDPRALLASSGEVSIMFQGAGKGVRKDLGIRRASMCVVACGLRTLLFACSPRTLNRRPSVSGGGVAGDTSPVQRAVTRVDPRYGKLQMSFEPNRGQ